MTDKPENDETSAGNKAEEKKPESGIGGKIPDISGLADKFDFDKILGGIKSMISSDPAAAVNADPNDALGMKMDQLSQLFKEIGDSHMKLAQDYKRANDLLVGIYKDLEAVRAKK